MAYEEKHESTNWLPVNFSKKMFIQNKTKKYIYFKNKIE